MPKKIIKWKTVHFTTIKDFLGKIFINFGEETTLMFKYKLLIHTLDVTEYSQLTSIRRRIQINCDLVEDLSSVHLLFIAVKISVSFVTHQRTPGQKATRIRCFSFDLFKPYLFINHIWFIYIPDLWQSRSEIWFEITPHAQLSSSTDYQNWHVFRKICRWQQTVQNYSSYKDSKVNKKAIKPHSSNEYLRIRKNPENL